MPIPLQQTQTSILILKFQNHRKFAPIIFHFCLSLHSWVEARRYCKACVEPGNTGKTIKKPHEISGPNLQTQEEIQIVWVNMNSFLNYTGITAGFILTALLLHLDLY